MCPELAETLTSLLGEVGCPDIGLGDVEIRGSDPVLACRFRAGEGAALALAGRGAIA